MSKLTSLWGRVKRYVYRSRLTCVSPVSVFTLPALSFTRKKGISFCLSEEKKFQPRRISEKPKVCTTFIMFWSCSHEVFSSVCANITPMLLGTDFFLKRKYPKHHFIDYIPQENLHHLAHRYIRKYLKLMHFPVKNTANCDKRSQHAIIFII